MSHRVNRCLVSNMCRESGVLLLFCTGNSSRFGGVVVLSRDRSVWVVFAQRCSGLSCLLLWRVSAVSVLVHFARKSASLSVL